MWDGRASSLEEQIRLPLTHPDEMGATYQHAVERFAADADYTRAFAEAFPGSPGITSETIARALAAFERSLVSPPTRFDRWIAGDQTALSPSEQNGFAIFTGRGRCINCHTGFAFTDHGFYDIGLPSEDLGRGPDPRPARGRPGLQDANAARVGVDGALHARRLDRHPRRPDPHLRDGRRRAADPQPRPAAEPAAHQTRNATT